jgi:hypothetical protein
MTINKGKVAVLKISSVLTPADGVSLDDAIADAELAGFQAIDKDYVNNRALIVWYERKDDGDNICAEKQSE